MNSKDQIENVHYGLTTEEKSKSEWGTHLWSQHQRLCQEGPKFQVSPWHQDALPQNIIS